MQFAEQLRNEEGARCKTRANYALLESTYSKLNGRKEEAGEAATVAFERFASMRLVVVVEHSAVACSSALGKRSSCLVDSEKAHYACISG